LQTLFIVGLLISLNVISTSDQTVHLPYLNTKQISAKSEVFEGVFGKLLFRIVNYLLCLKITVARSDEHDEKSTRPTSDLTR